MMRNILGYIFYYFGRYAKFVWPQIVERTASVSEAFFLQNSGSQFTKVWLVCFGLNGPLRQYFSLYRAVSQRKGEGKEK